MRTRTLEAAEEESTTTYAYDISGRLTSADDPVSGGAFSFTWDADSRLSRLDLPASGGYATYTYNEEKHLARVESGPDTYDYLYDNRGGACQQL